MVIDIDRISHGIASEPLHHLAWHSSVQEVGGVPVPAAMWPEMVFQSLAIRVMQPNPLRGMNHGIPDSWRA
jgi:hypothetical protein